jgi:hypothetical protein
MQDGSYGPVSPASGDDTNHSDARRAAVAQRLFDVSCILRPVKRRRSLVVIGAILLLTGTALVFRAFDSSSHSASDTLRPFVITMAPVWAVSVAAVRVLLTDRR